MMRLAAISIFVLLFASSAAARLNDDAACLRCHSITLDGTEFSTSRHAEGGCVSCHTNADATNAPHDNKIVAKPCESCHIKVYNRYAMSVHGIAFNTGVSGAPGCLSCHDPHKALHKPGVMRKCLGCHPGQAQPVSAFEKICPLIIKGHAKSDDPVLYRPDNCVACHQGDIAHGGRITEHKCMSCHSEFVFHATLTSPVVKAVNASMVLGFFFLFIAMFVIRRRR